MTRLLSFTLIIILINFSSAFYINAKNSFILTSQNFSDGIKDVSIFVLFIEDPEGHDKFLQLWDEVGEVAKAEEVSKDLKFGIVDCHNNKPLCQEYGVNEKIQLKFFGKKNSWIGVQEFLESTIKDVLREDVLIEKFKKPGKLFVLFKVVYCPYCKETMDEWIHVAEHFKNNKDVFVASIDCGRHREYCAQYDALKFPRIRFIYNTSGDKKVDFYDGERTAKDMIEFCESSLNRYK